MNYLVLRIKWQITKEILLGIINLKNFKWKYPCRYCICWIAYTWWNKNTIRCCLWETRQTGGKSVMAKHILRCRMETLPVVGSDHGPSFLRMDCWHRIVKYPFLDLKTNGYYRKVFLHLVQQTWRKCVKGLCAYDLARKIELLKKKTKI